MGLKAMKLFSKGMLQLISWQGLCFLNITDFCQEKKIICNTTKYIYIMDKLNEYQYCILPAIQQTIQKAQAIN